MTDLFEVPSRVRDGSTGIAKAMSSLKAFLVIRGSILCVFLFDLGCSCSDISALEIGLEIDCFFRVALGILNGTRK